MSSSSKLPAPQHLSDEDRTLRHRASLADLAFDAQGSDRQQQLVRRSASSYRPLAPSHGGDLDVFLRDMRRWMGKHSLPPYNDEAKMAASAAQAGGGSANSMVALKRDSQLSQYRDLPDAPDSLGSSPTSSIVYLDKLRQESPLSPPEQFAFDPHSGRSGRAPHRSANSLRRYSTHSPPDEQRRASSRRPVSTAGAGHLVSPGHSYNLFKSANAHHLDRVFKRRSDYRTGRAESSGASAITLMPPVPAAEARNSRWDSSGSGQRRRSHRHRRAVGDSGPGYPSSSGRDYERQHDRRLPSGSVSLCDSSRRPRNRHEFETRYEAYSDEDNDGIGEDPASEDDITDEDARRLEEFLMLRRLRKQQKRRLSPPPPPPLRPPSPARSDYLWQLGSPTADYLRQSVSSRSPSPQPLMQPPHGRGGGGAGGGGSSSSGGIQDVFRKPMNPPPRAAVVAAASKRSRSPEPPNSAAAAKQGRYY
ncbi:hypothetical protein BOX15_Mlig020557g3 [Macrostomum lignano]|uniref:Uncharacterized protein n=1 Tax=Macrostomum lignano TaxID=282301 RepID=A0A267E0E9_9PLAT|nr:hypothetical protein BOX15_Mlig020557g3 [Macrostomum lignano]